MKNALLLSAFLFISGNISGQKILSLKPFIGRQTPLCRLVKQDPNADALTVSQPLVMNWSPGIWLTLKLNDDWTVQSGLEAGLSGWHFDFKKNQRFINKWREGYYAFHRTNRLQFLVQRRLRTITALNLNPENETYVLNFDFYVTAGFVYTHVPARGSGTDTTLFNGYEYNGQMEFDYTYDKFTHRNNGGIYIGVGAQFYHHANARVDLTLYYSQGLSDILITEFNFRQGDTRHQATIKTRGSVFGATLAYPIRLKTFERKQV